MASAVETAAVVSSSCKELSAISQRDTMAREKGENYGTKTKDYKLVLLSS